MLGDERVFHRVSLAKKTVAFFRISFSIFRSRTSSRSLRISACSGVNFPLPRNACPSSVASSCSLIHRPIMLALMPKLRAASARLQPCSNTRLMASSLTPLNTSFLQSFSTVSSRGDYSLTGLVTSIKPLQNALPNQAMQIDNAQGLKL